MQSSLRQARRRLAPASLKHSHLPSSAASPRSLATAAFQAAPSASASTSSSAAASSLASSAAPAFEPSPVASSSLSSAAARFNPSFPCIDAHEARESRLVQQARERGTPLRRRREPLESSFPPMENKEDPKGEEPSYSAPTASMYQTYTHSEPLSLTYAPPLPSFTIAYETWGTLNADRSNAILLHTGLSASSHAASTAANPAPGWWEKFIGPGKALDTNRYFVICCNALGGCYGSTGPASVIPEGSGIEGEGVENYASRFPVISIFDMVNAQFKVLDSLGIGKLYASVGASMGGMLSIASGHLYPDRVGKLASISGTARSGLTGVALRFAQRSVLMADPNWNRGFYYDALPPHAGMKLARQIATITYRSGPEWEQRFGRRMRSQEPLADGSVSLKPPALCPDFLIETYLDHQGEQWCLKYDANSFIYVSKAMDLFDMTASALEPLAARRAHFDALHPPTTPGPIPPPPPSTETATPAPRQHLITSHAPFLDDLARGLRNLREIPTLVLGVQSDILFPVDQQRDFAEALRMAGNDKVSYFELGGVWGHDTFLIDTQNVGGALSGFLAQS